MKLTKTLLLLSSALGLVSAGYGLHAYAEGAPTMKPLFYAGTLEANGKLASGAHSITLTFFDAETAGNQVCLSETPNAPVESGRFRVELSADCLAKLQMQPDVWVSMLFAGPDGVPHQLPLRTKIGAVPFSMEAQHSVLASKAVNADEAMHAASATSATAASGGLATQVVPAGAVMAFDLDACPPGWSEFAAARGRAVIGTNPTAAAGVSARMRGQALGEERHQLTTAELPAHTHSGTTGRGNPMGYRVVVEWNGTNTANNHIKGWAGGGFTDYNDGEYALSAHTHNFTTDNGTGGNQPHNVMQPSTVLLYCKKN
jgi:microcystin-dependent protein